jgi:hypothetical protein
MINAYLIISVLVFLFLSILWSKKTVQDAFLKLIFIALVFLGLAVLMQINGLFIKN